MKCDTCKLHLNKECETQAILHCDFYVPFKTYDEKLRDRIVELQETLAGVTFALETVAHLQGKEKELLPFCDKARDILEDNEANHLLEF